jgi:hypothetical protein
MNRPYPSLFSGPYDKIIDTSTIFIKTSQLLGKRQR